jgi:hypothetical protein
MPTPFKVFSTSAPEADSAVLKLPLFQLRPTIVEFAVDRRRTQ